MSDLGRGPGVPAFSAGPKEGTQAVKLISRTLAFLATWIFGFVILLAVVGLLLPDDDGASGIFLYPAREGPGFDAGISRTLVAHEISGCDDYTYSDAGGGEYHVACWSAEDVPTYYVVWPSTNSLMGTHKE